MAWIPEVLTFPDFPESMRKWIHRHSKESLAPVSYTHLDVYKRQVGNSMARNCCVLLTVVTVRSYSAQLMKK